MVLLLLQNILSILDLLSLISFILNDDHNIAERIKKANQSMGALKCFWDAKEVDLRSKFLIYNAIPISLLLWGSESWALTKVLIKKLEVFHLRNIRRILGIKWSEVIDDKITNKQVLEKIAT